MILTVVNGIMKERYMYYKLLNKNVITTALVALMLLSNAGYCEAQGVVALVEDSATVKRFYKRNGKFILHPENETLSDIVLDYVEILGKVTGLVRKF